MKLTLAQTIAALNDIAKNESPHAQTNIESIEHARGQWPASVVFYGADEDGHVDIDEYNKMRDEVTEANADVAFLEEKILTLEKRLKETTEENKMLNESRNKSQVIAEYWEERYLDLSHHCHVNVHRDVP